MPFEENGRSGGQERNNSGGMVFDAGEDVIHLLYFHTEICPKCEKAEAYLGQLPKQVEASGKEYPVVVTTLSVAEDKNALLFFSLIAALPKGCLRYGLGFLTGKFLAYVLLGLAAAGAISFIPFETFVIFRKGLNAVLLAACLFLAYGNFRDCFYAFRGEYGKIKMQLPGKLRKWNDKLVKKMAGNSGRKAFLLLVFGGGMVIALGEFFCTGQIYLASILQWMQSAQNSGVPVTALVLYSAALCLPAFILLVLIVRGRSALFLVDRNLKGMPLVKLCNGILFVVFAVIALASM